MSRSVCLHSPIKSTTFSSHRFNLAMQFIFYLVILALVATATTRPISKESGAPVGLHKRLDRDCEKGTARIGDDGNLYCVYWTGTRTPQPLSSRHNCYDHEFRFWKDSYVICANKCDPGWDQHGNECWRRKFATQEAYSSKP